MKSMVTIQSKSDLFGNEENKKKAREVFGKFLYEGELSILFGGSGTGKSILANDIAFFAGGGGHDWGDIECPNIPSLYIDLEMSTRQFASRYATAEEYIPNTYRRAMIDTSEMDDEDILPEVKKLITAMQAEADAPKLIIIDNITNGFGSIMNANKMKKLVFEFKKLKEKFGLTILLIAHCPKLRPWSPLTLDSLGGSKMIANFIDSAFAIGQSRCGKPYKYIKQVKTRESHALPDVMSVKLTNDPFLHYQFLGYNGELAHLDGTIEFEKVELTPEQEAILTNMLMKGEHTYAEIADFLDLTEDFVIDFAIENRL